jgi:hypothetical protein
VGGQAHHGVTPMRLSLVLPYYRNPRILCRQLLVWRDEWSADLKRDIDVVIVDDGSPDETASDALATLWNGDRTGLPSLCLYRVTEDRPWHQHAARNLGAHIASAPWLLMTDIDHVVPPSTLTEVLRLLPDLGTNDVLTFGRVDAPAEPAWEAEDWPEFARTRRADGSLKPHVNSFVVSREHYWKLGGYDEDLCGIYGTDQHFRTRLFGVGSATHHLDHAPLIRVDREVIADASTRDVDRKTPGRGDLKRAVLARKAAEGRAGQTTTLNFPWEKVAL